MSGLQLALMVLLIVVLIGQLRIGAQVEYGEKGLLVRVRAGAFLIPVFPVKQKPGGTKQKPPKDAAPRRKGGDPKLVLKFIPLVLDTAKRFRRRLRIDKLDMELTISAPDPADAAVRYGQANALLGSLWQPMTQAFHVKDGHAHVEVDFDAGASEFYLFASLSLTIGQAVCLVSVFGWKALSILIQNRFGRGARVNQGEAV